MKEDINLLSPEIKRQRMRSLYAHRGHRLFWVTLLGLGSLYAAYGGAWWILTEHKRVLANTSTQIEGNGMIKAEVRSLNEFLRAVHNHFQSYPAWAPLIEEALAATPTTIRITALSLNTALSGAEPTLVLKGTSASRAVIIEYEQKLRGLPSVAALEAPLQNLASGDSNTFSFTIYRHVDD